MNLKNMTCWVVSEGIAGTENQCIAVAEALGIPFEVKRIALKQPWKALSPYIGFEQAWSFIPEIKPPYPDLLIAAGRKAIAASRYIKKVSGGKTFTVQIQDPRVSPEQFDLVAVPFHDPARGDNVIVTDAAPNRVSVTSCELRVASFPELTALPSPRVAVLLGGNSKAYRFDARAVAEQLSRIEGSLMITPSRRTGAENVEILKSALSNRHPVGTSAASSHERDPEKSSIKDADTVDTRCFSSASPKRVDDVYFYEGDGPNPYFAMLALADFIVVSADSASMLSDACSTGKPVYMIPMKGGHRRIDKLHKHLQDIGALRVLGTGNLEAYSYEPLNDAAKIAEAITERLKQ